MLQNTNMDRQKSVNKFIKMLLTIFAYFVSFLLIMMNNLHFTEKTKNAKTSAEPVKIQQVLPKNSYKTIKSQYFSVDNPINIIPKIQFNYNGKLYVIDNNCDISNYQKSFINNGFSYRVNIMKFAVANGFNKYQAVSYAFPEIQNTINKLAENIYQSAQDASLSVVKNTAKSIVENSKNGVKVDDVALFNNIYDSFLIYKEAYIFPVPTIEILPQICDDDIKEINNIRAEFSTSFNNSVSQRKNNIKLALNCFDGLVLNPGEMFSFNNKTGLRTAKNGYQKAKIIKNGMFIEEYGGGVCQVSTTLYNACLLADLDIIESHCHSLPVSYVQAGFDAMVNSGSSDLIVKNNHDYPVLIATSSENDLCKVVVYGKQKTQKIVKKSEKISENLHFETFFTSANENYNLPEVGEDSEIVLAPGRGGYTTKSWLEYYNGDVLVKTKPLRTSIYNPAKRVILVSKNDKRIKEQ